jgi:hypothetical protein
MVQGYLFRKAGRPQRARARHGTAPQKPCARRAGSGRAPLAALAGCLLFVCGVH